MKMSRSSASARRLWKGVAVLALSLACLSETAFAAQYTKQEKANMELVKGLYDALDAADAKGNTSEAIVGIAEKYIAPDYKQHAVGGQSGRENFVKMFQRMPTGGPPPGAAPGGAGGKPPAMEPAKIVAFMADGDLVVRISSRGPMMIWNMFRVQNGQLAEHWDAGTGAPAAAAGGPPGAPPKN